MLSKLHIPMTSGGDVKVSLHFVGVDAAEDAAAVLFSPSRGSGHLPELLPARSSPEKVMHIILLVLSLVAARHTLQSQAILLVRWQ